MPVLHCILLQSVLNDIWVTVWGPKPLKLYICVLETKQILNKSDSEQNLNLCRFTQLNR